MKAEITYIHHNCFFMEIEGVGFVFDVPTDEHLDKETLALLQGKVEAKDIYVFISHSHDDHFREDLPDLFTNAHSIHWIFSYDVGEMYPRFENLADAVFVEPEEHYEEFGLNIEGFESTDLGVGFLFEFRGKRIWFGGDVAEWAWDNQDEKSYEFAVDHYKKTLETLQERPPALAFVNTDKRLTNWAGAMKFLHHIQPAVFVPMHTFGYPEWVNEFIAQAGETGSRIFNYDQAGDSETFEF